MPIPRPCCRRLEARLRISVVTVCRNAAGSIAGTIESVLGQDYSDRELLVVDGASTDGTQAIVARFAPDVRLISKPDRGMYDALNTGLKLFDGDAVGSLNADDRFCDRTALSRIAAALIDADIVHGDLDFVTGHEVAPGSSGEGVEKRVVRHWRARDRPASGFRTGWMPAHPTFYARRAVVAAVGEFDLALKTAADYDYMLRAVELHDFRLGRVRGVVVDMMQGGRSTASLRAHLAHNLEALGSRRRWLNAGVVDRALVAKPVRKVGQFLIRPDQGA